MTSRFEHAAPFNDENQGRPKGSVFKSIFSPRAHKRSQSGGTALTSRFGNSNSNPDSHWILPGDHPHAQSNRPLRELGEKSLNQGTANGSPSKHGPADTSGNAGLHKKTKSSVSLKSLLKDKDKKDTSSKISASEDVSKREKPKKTKSSTSLSAIFRRSQRGKKDGSSASPKEQGVADANMMTSDMSYYGNSSIQDQMATRYITSSGRTLHEEMSLYTPKCYSPSKQRNFHDFQQPSLTRRSDKPRPKSDYLSSGSSSVRDALRSIHSRRPSVSSTSGFPNFSRKNSADTSISEKRRNSNTSRGSRVMAAIAAFSAKEKPPSAPKQVDPKEIESAFEQLLESRNIPHNMRDKMRSLNTNIKADFIDKNCLEGDSPTSTSQRRSHRRVQSKESNVSCQDEDAHSKKGGRSRPLSGGFGSSKIDFVPFKKQRAGSAHSQKRPKSVDNPLQNSSRGTQGIGINTGLPSPPAQDVAGDPADFVHYLKEVQKPEIVEVGKLHKLRILLRNETVAWVNAFISHGGMDELVGLLYRIINVEWREEHEDSLMHEVLLCLKALCTTSPALQQLCKIETELFPTLLRMIFGEEKKGPSEFSTRGIVISLLFTHLGSATPAELPSRAQTILSYLRDPSPPEEAQPLAFIANIYQSRPYQVWCKEMSNVTKEVFWIFLHHLNVVPIAKPDEYADASEPFVKRFFPPPHTPVPAAPYIGGVEWDATNYLAGHLDLINGILASLPTREERNMLRNELRASGIEKVMGRSFRTCKEKLYPALHEGLKIWVSAAAEDGWDYQFVREGPPRDAPPSVPPSPEKGPGSPKKKKGIVSESPPKLDLNVGIGACAPTGVGLNSKNHGMDDWI